MLLEALEIVHAGCPLCFGLGRGQSWKQKAGERRDDRNHNQELDQNETTLLLKSRSATHCFSG